MTLFIILTLLYCLTEVGVRLYVLTRTDVTTPVSKLAAIAIYTLYILVGSMMLTHETGRCATVAMERG